MCKSIPFETLMDVVEFALENTLVKDIRDGQLWRQSVVLMGDPHSPGMTIGTCAWMEDEWMQTIDTETKKYFRAKRYMDDVLYVYAKNGSWEHDRLWENLCQECYLPPLKLEQGKDGTFLETSFTITDNQVETWLKNDNKIGETKVTRYANIECYSTFEQKKQVLNNCLRKVHEMANNDMRLKQSAIQKACGVQTETVPSKNAMDSLHYDSSKPGTQHVVQGTEDDLRNRTQAHKHTRLEHTRLEHTNTSPILTKQSPGKPGGKRRVQRPGRSKNIGESEFVMGRKHLSTSGPLLSWVADSRDRKEGLGGGHRAAAF